MVKHLRFILLAALLVAVFDGLPGRAQRRQVLRLEDVPLFELRAQVTRNGGAVPTSQTFTFGLNTSKQTVKSQGTGWSPWLDFGSADAESALRQYSNRARGNFPIALSMRVAPAVDPTEVNVQVLFQGQTRATSLHGDLFGPTLGIMVWRESGSGKPRAGTMADYDRRYWHEFDAAALPADQRPKHFLLVDRFIGGDNDRLDWQEGISHVAETGITAMLLPPAAPLRDMLIRAGVKRIALGAGVVCGPLGLECSNEQVEKWSLNFASAYFKAGYQPSDFSLFALADEPGWYYPSALQTVKQSPALLKTFRDYLADQHLTPAMLSKTDWDQVYPTGRSGAAQNPPLPARRLFYWTCRFFPWFAAEHLRQATEQLHRVFTPELKTFTNWNNFPGQFYFEGFPANNPDPSSPDAAMAAPDWFEFGKLHATDLLWTEDWFGNGRAFQWSYYAAKLRSIASKDGLEFGGYIIGQVTGSSPDDLVRRIMALVGNGAKAVFYYNFGPAYNFPGNSYSEIPGVPAQLARADRMIAKAEDVLWPGREQQAQVAILQPRSAEVWDGNHIPRNSRVLGAASNNLNGSNLDYMVEEFDEYVALEMSNIPTDFISEDGLTDGTLNKYKALYITEPDIPSEGQEAIVRWVENGGTLAMVPGAGQGDRYDEPAKILASLAGCRPYERSYIPSALALNKTGMIGSAPVFGNRTEPPSKGRPSVSFEDHWPAVTESRVQKGNIVNFSFFPGLSYARLAFNPHLIIQVNHDADFFRNLILTPVRTAEISPPVQVDVPYVETPMLLSSSGAAITLLNWTGADLSSIKLTVRSPFQVGRVESVTHGTIPFHRQGGLVTFSLPLGAADIVELRR